MAYSVQALYGYDPVMGPAYAAAAVFLLLAMVMLWSNLKFPPNRFMHVLVFAALGEMVGFAIRIVSVHYPTLLTFIVTTLFLLLMPNFIALVNYIAVGRLMAFSDLKVAFLRPSWLAKIFFISDLFSFGIQGMGGGMLTSTNPSTQDLGKNIILIGLALQSLALLLFLFVTITIQTQPKYRLKGVPDAQRIFIGLYVTTALLFIRSIYRLAEYASGRKAYLTTHEWPFYVFDSIAMAAAFVVYALPAVHYGRCLNSLKELLGPPPAAGEGAELPVTSAGYGSGGAAGLGGSTAPPSEAAGGGDGGLDTPTGSDSTSMAVVVHGPNKVSWREGDGGLDTPTGSDSTSMAVVVHGPNKQVVPIKG